MSILFSSQPLPTTGQLIKATFVAAAIAGTLLVTVILPAEYGVDPTGIGARIGLDVLRAPAEASAQPMPATPANAAAARPDATTEAHKAAAVFGAVDNQTFDVGAVARGSATPRRSTLVLTLEPGKGSEVKSVLKAGEGFVFHWTATGDVAVDMHGENPLFADGGFTSYWIEGAQREASGTFVAPFDGTHGWYWLNRNKQAVTIEVEVTGFQPDLHIPNKK